MAAFPTTRLLSHDLLEGTFARAGLVTDVEVFDDYPTRYLTSTRRTHRWIRGDWQLLRWLTSRVPGACRLQPRSAVVALAMEDRRQHAPQRDAARAVRPGSSPDCRFFPDRGLRGSPSRSRHSPRRGSCRSLFAAARPPREQAWRPYYAALAQRRIARPSAVGSRGRAASGSDAARDGRDRADASPACSARGAACSSGKRRRTRSRRRRTAGRRSGAACGRRCCWARRSCRSSPGAERSTRVERCPLVSTLPAWMGAGRSPGCWRRRWRSPSAAADSARPRSRRRRARGGAALRGAPLALLRALRHRGHALARARQLPGDHPSPVVASRTSPTNIGLQLLATVSACDLGFLTRGEMVERLERAFDSLDRMPRVRGTSSTGTRSRICACSIRRTSRPWIRGISPAISSRSPQGCIGIAGAPVDDGRVWAAIEAEGR